MTEVSAVILNYNRGELTARAIESVLNQQEIEPELIVIDNGSSDGSADKIAAAFGAKIKMIRNPENRGFSPACNQAFKLASGEWIALINNDAVADPAWLKNSLKAAKSNSKAGVVVPKILDYFDREKLDGIGVGFWLDGISRARRRGELDSRRLDLENPQIASGCACLLSRKMLEELSGFDPDFFAYGEDTDLGIRAFLSGWECVFEPSAVVYHMYSRTSSAGHKYSGLKLFLVERNRTWILFRYYPLGLILASPFTTCARFLYQAYQVAGFKSRGPGLGAGAATLALLKTIYSSLVSMPRQIKLRRKWLGAEAASRSARKLISDNPIPLKEISRLD